MNLEVVPTGAGSVNALESEGVRPRSQTGVRSAGRIHVFRTAFLDADSMQFAWVSWYLVTASDAATPHSGRTRREGNMGGRIHARTLNTLHGNIRRGGAHRHGHGVRNVYHIIHITSGTSTIHFIFLTGETCAWFLRVNKMRRCHAPSAAGIRVSSRPARSRR